MAKKFTGVRLEENLRQKLEAYAEAEKKRTGYKITLSGVINKILEDWLEKAGIEEHKQEEKNISKKMSRTAK